jgi:tetratricopeptide (TPR) repeat protein
MNWMRPTSDNSLAAKDKLILIAIGTLLLVASNGGLAWAKQSGEQKNICAELSTKAQECKQNRDIPGAIALYKAEIREAEKIGDVSSRLFTQESIWMQIGVLYRDLGEMAEAEKAYLECVRLQKVMNGPGYVVGGLRNLSGLWREIDEKKSKKYADMAVAYDLAERHQRFEIAQKRYVKSVADAEAGNNSFLLYCAKRQLARFYIEAKKYDQALPIVDQLTVYARDTKNYFVASANSRKTDTKFDREELMNDLLLKSELERRLGKKELATADFQEAKSIDLQVHPLTYVIPSSEFDDRKKHLISSLFDGYSSY